MLLPPLLNEYGREFNENFLDAMYDHKRMYSFSLDIPVPFARLIFIPSHPFHKCGLIHFHNILKI